MKKRILSILLAAIMIVSLLPTAAFATAVWYDVYVDGIRVTSNNMGDVLGEADGAGATVTYTPAGAGTNDKLTLNGATLNNIINYIGNATLDIEVIGNNTITPPVESRSGIVTWRDVNEDDYPENTNASLNIYGEGTLTVTFTATTANQNNGIFANNDLTIKDTEISITTHNPSTYNRGLRAGNDLTIDGAKVSVTTGTSTNTSTNAFHASHDVIIKNGADVTAVAGNSASTTFGEGSVAIFAVNDVKISGTATKVNTTAGQGLNSCGISAKNGVTISGGTVTATAGTATAASVGILAPTAVTISGGTVTAKAGTGALKAAIAATANGLIFGTLTVGAADRVANITGANGITEGKGTIPGGGLVQSGTEPVVISFAVSTEQGISDAITSAPNDKETIIKLGDNINLTNTITIPTGKDITLDLNGKVLNAGGSKFSVIKVEEGGKLTLIDSAPTTEHAGYVDGDGLWYPGTPSGGETVKNITGGIITGGIAKVGGGIYNEGCFTLNGGTIAGNKSDGSVFEEFGSTGGGVYNAGSFTMTGGAIDNNKSGFGNMCGNGGGVVNAGSFVMEGGEISGNWCDSEGGGVLNDGSGSFTLSGGIISNNYAGAYGGGVKNSGTFTMEGGEIRANYSDMEGGGVNNGGTMTMTGGKVKNNSTMASPGGGIRNDGDLYLGGNAVISGNLSGEAADDLDNENNVEIVTGDAGNKVAVPVDGMYVGFHGKNILQASEGDRKYFFSNVPTQYVAYYSGQLYLSDYPNDSKAVRVTPSDNGVVYIDKQYVLDSAVSNADRTVTVTVVPEDGYGLKSISYHDGTGDQSMIDAGNGTYTFVMPWSDVTVTAEFEEEEETSGNLLDILKKAALYTVISDIFYGNDEEEVEEAPVFVDAPVIAAEPEPTVEPEPIVEPTDDGFPFKDVPETDPLYEDVYYVWDKDLMDGVAEDEFAKNLPLNRAMLVTILWRLEGEPYVNYAMSFKDVPAGQWYTEAVRWAQSNKIVTGFNDDEFKPEQPVSREQLAAILYRYAEFKGYDVSVDENTNFLSFDDVFDIAEYAQPAMFWALDNGFIADIDGYLHPADDATRGDVAVFFHGFCEKY